MPSYAPYSYTHLSAFKICPRRYFHYHVLKDVPRTSSEAMIVGIEVHKTAEQFLKGEAGLPADTMGADLIRTVAEFPVLHVELALGVDRGGKGCAFDAPECWLRGKLDVVLGDHKNVILLDWKTGKVRVNFFELGLHAVLFAGAFNPDTIQGVYVFLAHGEMSSVRKLDPVEHHAKAARLIRSIEEDDILDVPNPNPLCHWCDVGGCEYHPEAKRNRYIKVKEAR